MAQSRRDSKGRDALRVAVAGLNGSTGKVGWFESSKYEDGTPVAGVAAVQEFGNATIPPRSFFRTTNAEKQKDWAATAGHIAAGVITGKLQPSAMVEAVSLQAEGDVRAKITKITEPPLSLLTLQARKYRKEGGTVTGKTLGGLMKARDNGPPDVSGVSTKPLNDSGYMLATLTTQVLKK